MLAKFGIAQITEMLGPRLVETEMATEAKEDWSRVRSPSRAKRRLKRGFAQNIRHWRKPSCYFVKGENTFYIHPDVMKELRCHLAFSMADNMDKRFMRALCGKV